MKHKTYLVGLALAILPMMGCLKVEKKSEQVAQQKKAEEKRKVPTKQPLNRELRIDDIFIEYVGLSQPNIYDVVFSWPQTRDRVRVSANGQVWFLTNTAETDRYVMDNLQGGKSYPILVEILDQQNHVITSQARTIEVPRDYVFPKSFTLTGNMEITNSRVFMKSSVVTTNQFNLTIKTQNLVVIEKSFLQSFQFGTKAGVGVAGRNGGTIRIEAVSAIGELDLMMNSEAGGNGKQGSPGNSCTPTAGSFCINFPACEGESGYAAGKNPEVYVKIDDIKDFKFYQEEVISEGGDKGFHGGEKTEEGYPRISGITNACFNKPSKGASAQPSKICLSLSGVASGEGCL